MIRELRMIVLILGTILPTLGFAEAIAHAKIEHVTITLYSEPCAIAVVDNLKNRATWSENGKTFEGCFGVSQLGVVMLYFADDRSVAAVPTQSFVRISGV